MMSRASSAFSAAAVTNQSLDRLTPDGDEREREIKRLHRIKEDRSLSTSEFFANSYFENLYRELKEKRKELRSKLSAGSGESIGRFQVLDEMIEKFDEDSKKCEGY